MNHALWAQAGARVLAAAFLVAGAAACDRNKASDARESAAPSPSANVIGTTPAAPTGDPPGTTPVTKDQSELNKHEERTQQPLEGQNNSFMTESQRDSQRAGKVDEQTQRRQQ